MIKEIALAGITTTPDDYVCSDGDLSFSTGLVQDSGSLRNAPEPETYLTLPDGCTMLYIHKQPSYTNYIMYNSTSILYVNSADLSLYKDYSDQIAALAEQAATGSHQGYVQMQAMMNMRNQLLHTLLTCSKPYGITSIGNSLNILTDSGLRNAIYKDGAYTLMPADFPVLRHAFGLVGTYDVETYKTKQVTYSAKGESLPYNTRVSYAVQDGYYPLVDDTVGGYLFVSMPNLTGKMLPATFYKINFTQSAGTPVGDVYIRYYKNANDGLDDHVKQDHIVHYDKVSDSGKDKTYYVRTTEEYDHFAMAVLQSNGDYHLILQWTIWKSDYDAKYCIVQTDDDNGCDTVNAAAADYIQRHSYDKARHIYPFFARLAAKLYDGSYISLTAPTLMLPNTGQMPCVQLFIDDDQSLGTDANYSSYLQLSALCCDLQLRLPSTDTLALWKDYISDICVAITEPITNYDASINDKEEQKKKFYITDQRADGISEAALAITNTTPLTCDTQWKHDVYTEDDIYQHIVQAARPSYFVHLPEFEDTLTHFTSFSSFHVIKDIPLQDILEGQYNDMTALKLTNFKFDSIVNKTQVTEDYSSHNTYIPRTAYAYNSRLHIGCYDQLSFAGWHPQNFSGYVINQPEEVWYKAVVEFTDNNNSYTADTGFWMHTPDGIMPAICMASHMRYFYFPSRNAKSCTIYKFTGTLGEGSYQKAVLELKQHPVQIGRYWFDDYNEPAYVNCSASEKAGLQAEILDITRDYSRPLLPRHNYVKISEVNDPFNFTDARTYAFDSSVMGMAAAVTALSTGQQGQFDLYIFTQHDGIWSLRINDSGTYSNYIPVSRECCTNADSITPVDGSVIYVSDRGLMSLTGAEDKCLSDSLARPLLCLLSDTSLQNISKMLPAGIDTQQVIDFRQYAQTAICLYDSRNSRIIVAQPSASYAYSLNLTSGLWTMLNNTITYALNSYPECLAGDDSSNILNLSTSITPAALTGIDATQTARQTFLLTRPFSLDMSNDFKTIDQLRLNGVMLARHATMRLYGSNDLINWTLVNVTDCDTRMTGTSGTGLRFYRLAVLLTMYDSESLDSLTLSFRAKGENTKLF